MKSIYIKNFKNIQDLQLFSSYNLKKLITKKLLKIY